MIPFTAPMVMFARIVLANPPPQPGLGFGGDHAGFNLGGYLGFGEDLSCGHLDVRQKAQHPAGIHSSERRGGLKGG